VLAWREERCRAAELRHNIKEEALRQVGVLSQHQKTKELVQGKGHGAVRRETTEGGTPRVQKEEGGWKHPGMMRRAQLRVEGGWGRSRRDLTDENVPRWTKMVRLENLVRSDDERHCHGH
jgi:hypothetical protein